MGKTQIQNTHEYFIHYKKINAPGCLLLLSVIGFHQVYSDYIKISTSASLKKTKA